MKKCPFKNINVLSVFNGMGCVWLALDELGVKINKRYVSEIDKYANIVNDANYPNTIHLGDVRNVKASELEIIDLFVGGSPCQGFSFAGKQLNFDDPRSSLFFEYARILKEIQQINPNVIFLLENVPMKREYEAVISRYLGVEPIIINSRLLTAQNRKRLYWTNINLVQIDLFGTMKSSIPQPRDEGILLKDILQPYEEVDDKYYLSDKMIQSLINNQEKQKEKGNSFSFSPRTYETKKAACLNARYYKMGCDDNYIITHSLQPRTGKGQGGKGHLCKDDGESYCLDTGNSQGIQCINTYNNGRQRPQQDRIYNANGKSVCLDTGAGRWSVYYNKQIRKLTPIECERLQGVSDNYTNYVSNTQRYKMLGNGWTIPVITHILKHAFNPY